MRFPALGLSAAALCIVSMPLTGQAQSASTRAQQERVCNAAFKASITNPTRLAWWEQLCAGYQPGRPNREPVAADEAGGGRERRPPDRGGEREQRPVVLLPTGPSGQIPSQYEKLRRLPVKHCFWRARAGGPFGASGFCAVSSRMGLGAACLCSRPKRDGSREIMEGNVVSGPAPGAPPIVR